MKYRYFYKSDWDADFTPTTKKALQVQFSVRLIDGFLRDIENGAGVVGVYYFTTSAGFIKIEKRY